MVTKPRLLDQVREKIHIKGIFAQTAVWVYSRGYALTVELRYRYTLAFERPYSFMSALISAP
jgi:hypothetical protein